MWCNHKQYFQLTIGIFYQSRRSFTHPIRQLEELKQIYDLLKVQSLGKTLAYFFFKFHFKII
jgi:hypothetical protein